MSATRGVVYAVGADAGESCAWALVRHVWGQRPELLHLAEVFGQKTEAWLRRCGSGAEHAWARLVAELDGPLPAARALVWIETPPAQSKAFADGSRHTQASWIGLGRRVGLLEATWAAASGRLSFAERVQVSDWTRAWGPGQLYAHKRGDGTHRLTEVRRLVSGVNLEGVPDSRQVDVAESILIAGAAALHSRQVPMAARGAG